MSNKLLRVTQLDAVHLDNEIYKIFSKLVHECFAYLPPGLLSPYEPEINLLVKLVILHYSILKQGRTFGQKLLMIKYKNITRTKQLLYLLFSNIDYLKSRCGLFPVFRQVMLLEEFLKIFSFINLSIFLKSGTKPTCTDRVLSLDQVYDNGNIQRQFGSKYMSRELLWNSFIEILVYILPLINYHKLRRILNTFNPFHKRPAASCSSRILNVNTVCAYCTKPPITPYHMGCQHIFCYTCLKGNQTADTKFECPVCEFSSEPEIFERVIID